MKVKKKKSIIFSTLIKKSYLPSIIWDALRTNKILTFPLQTKNVTAFLSLTDCRSRETPCIGHYGKINHNLLVFISRILLILVTRDKCNIMSKIVLV